MKKLVRIILLLVVFISGLALTANAQNCGVIKIDKFSGQKGETISVPIYLENNPGIIALRFIVEYDETVLKLIEIQNGDVFEKSAVSVDDDLKSPLIFLYEDGLATKNNYNNGKIIVLKYEVLSENIPDSTVSIKIDAESTFNLNLENCSFKFVNCNNSEIPKSNYDSPKQQSSDINVSNENKTEVATESISSQPNADKEKTISEHLDDDKEKQNDKCDNDGKNNLLYIKRVCIILVALLLLFTFIFSITHFRRRGEKR